ncbi:putative GPI biosynthesis protein family Pig-F protein [Elsinoe australis]|uniref:Putative GPI biosynthesis protein family Pig-F protein n=1 Tax=Elsinoe australis TaxID=40998 RepID=A0A4V6DX47_9PEZI|nr:putative GPI biosynthesis protein family Pig-F protein [Elsinoe australis]
MSTKEAPATTIASKSKPQPIEIHSDPLSQAYSYIHIFAILSTFTYTFPSLVADPISTMTGSLLPLALLQGIYCAICLPGTQSSPSTSSKTKKKTPSPELSLGFRIIPALLSLTLTLTFGTPLLTALLLLFGAPFTSHQLHTLLCGAHIALLAAPQLVYVHGVVADKWLAIASLSVPIDEVFGASLGACVGAWVGAVPIPLDWDREWQRWPVTILAGAYGGWAVGKVLGGTVGRGRGVVLD